MKASHRSVALVVFAVLPGAACKGDGKAPAPAAAPVGAAPSTAPSPAPPVATPTAASAPVAATKPPVAATKPAPDRDRDGYCKMTITGAVTDAHERIGGGTMAFASDLWRDQPWKDVSPKVTLFGLNCGDSGDPWFVALSASNDSTPAEIGYGPRRYDVVRDRRGSKSKPGQIEWRIGSRHGDFEIEIMGETQKTDMMLIGLREPGWLEVTRFDDGGVTGTFHLPASVGNDGTPIEIDGEFAYPCTGWTEKCKASRGG